MFEDDAIIAKRRLDAYLSRITYKPGVEITTVLPMSEFNVVITVQIMRRVVDTYDPTREVDQAQAYSVSVRHLLGDNYEKFLDHFVVSMFHRLEAHDTDEWIRKDGKLLNDPHASFRQ